MSNVTHRFINSTVTCKPIDTDNVTGCIAYWPIGNREGKEYNDR
jgi:hypothetical protein